MPEPIIRVEKLSKSFGELEVLKDINMEVREGEVISVIGPSGSGKSTFLCCINLLETPNFGKIYYMGDVVNDKDYDRKKLHREVGMVFQRFNLFPHKTVLENITLAPDKLKIASKEENRAHAMELLRKVGLESKADERPSNLSGGQQQRVAIARALAAKPAILLADEPTGNLDSVTSQDVLSLLKVTSSRFGQTVVMITHNEEIAQMADRIIRIEDGKIRNGGEAYA